MNSIFNKLAIVAAMGLTALLWSCASDEPAAVSGTGAVGFSAFVGEMDQPATRALQYDPVTLSTYGDEKFYINSDVPSIGRQQLSVYNVSPGHTGELSSLDEDILWYDRNSEHYFFGWTMPWEDDTYRLGENPRSTVYFTEDYYKNLGLSQSSYHNCSILNKFLGAMTGPIDYLSNGEDVELHFQHLVSRIRVNSLKFMDDNGQSAEQWEGTMTIFQLPQTAIFDRRPTTDEGAPLAPRIIPDENAQEGIQFNVMSYAPSLIYICPDMNFADMGYGIQLTNSAKTQRHDFYGTFSSVQFKRVDTDQPEWDEGKSPTVLYAGEEMTVNITVMVGVRDGAPSASVTIGPWDTRNMGTATSQAKKGLYGNAAFTEMYNKFTKEYNQDTFDEFFDVYGQEIDGKKVFNMYEDAATSHRQMPVPKPGILDGLGHTFQFNDTYKETDSNSTWGGKKHDNFISIGLCRDIYITDGTHIVYVDSEYNVYVVDPKTMERTLKSKLEVPLPSNRSAYYIDLVTGESAYH